MAAPWRRAYAGAAARPSRRRSTFGGPGDALDLAALLVDGDDHRLPQARGPVGRLDRGGHPRAPRGFEPMLSSNRITPASSPSAIAPSRLDGALLPLKPQTTRWPASWRVVRSAAAKRCAAALTLVRSDAPGGGRCRERQRARREQRDSSFPRPHCGVDSTRPRAGAGLPQQPFLRSFLRSLRLACLDFARFSLARSLAHFCFLAALPPDLPAGSATSRSRRSG